jgi:peptidoglycan hydrolase-like protein with peptidoglycan-binding domain
MLTKEKVAAIFKSVVRIFPGMPSYQEREGLRTQDKIIREQLAARIDEQAKHIQEIQSKLTDKAILKPLSHLDRQARKIMRLADTIRFASYGYAGLFAGVKVDEQKLAQLYDYDLSLYQEIEELAVAVGNLMERQDDEWKTDSLADFQQAINRLEARLEKRKSIFNQN